MTERLSTLQRFEKRVFPEPMSGCWLWTGALKNGYGSLSLGKRREREYAHRFSYVTFVGTIEDGLVVCHRCDNQACVNPAHLFLGTQQENIEDMRRKGRNKPLGKGEDHRSARLTVQDVLAIRKAVQSGETRVSLAKRYGVTPQSIGDAAAGRHWAFV